MADYSLKFKTSLDTSQVNNQLRNLQNNLKNQIGARSSRLDSSVANNIDRAASVVNLRQTSRSLNLFGSSLESAARQLGDSGLGESIKNLTSATNTVIQGFTALGPAGAAIGGVVATLNIISESAAGFADLQKSAKEAADELYGQSNAVTSYSDAQQELKNTTVELKRRMDQANSASPEYFDVTGKQKEAASELRESAKAHKEAANLIKQFSAKLDTSYSLRERSEELLYGPMEKRFTTSELENQASDLRSQLEGALKIDPESVDNLDEYNKNLESISSQYSKVSSALSRSRDVDNQQTKSREDVESDIRGLLTSKNSINSIARIGGSVAGENITSDISRDVTKLVQIENRILYGIQSIQKATGAPSV